ncbi:MAG: glycogen/starch/alpha-glucan phosphorylase [Nitrospiraceae bacterium]|nr:glycogen/starch/alpha-glucan phosphorylase [Nitrospiraceae bacterium]
MRKKKKTLRESLLGHLVYDLAKDSYSATPRDKYHAVVLSLRQKLAENWIATQQEYYRVSAKRLYYLSLEFLLGRLLRNYALSLDVTEDYREAVEVLGLGYEELVELEWDAALGNGGLGRLAACFLDSLATLQLPGYGYGIRYEYGIFSQKIVEGFQVESADNWLRYGNPWEFPRPELLYPVRFYGRVSTVNGRGGRFRMEWTDGDEVMAMAYDYPVPGFRNRTVNTLRLWAAKSTREFNLDYFNSGDYLKAVEDKNSSESISKVLYPNDQSVAGKELRLKQQYFFVSATVRDILRRYRKFHATFHEFPGEVAIQLNDTHPSIAIPELMRVLVDEERVPWDDAWKIATQTFSYTNHTVLPEALETWPEGLLSHLLPRHHQIIQEIDRRHLIVVRERFPGSKEAQEEAAIITGDGDRHLHMARLAIIGSHAVNGVSALHSDILKNGLFRRFDALTPGKFLNVTNGVTQRRWLLQANPGLAGLITGSIGNAWTKDLEALRELEPLAGDTGFREEFRRVKKENKRSLAVSLGKLFRLSFPPDFLLDCQVKRFHEYKRQLLNLLHAVTIFNRIREGGSAGNFVPRTILFSGKAAPGYFLCKLIIKLIHCVAAAIDADPAARNLLRVVFVPNYSVTLAERIIPAADLSEQISTAGYEASGTGNMKFTLNGALTIGTLDGANIEIRREVGPENFFEFGLYAGEIQRMRGSYEPRRYYEADAELKQAVDQIGSGVFSPGEPGLFGPLVQSMLVADRFFVLADYASYVRRQEEAAAAYLDEEDWTRMAILNVARSGRFSGDRAVREYAGRIWGISPVRID